MQASEILTNNGNGHDPPPPRFLKIKQDDKFFSRLLSKEAISKGEPSFRVMYYGEAAGAVPFTWESQPGTPKHTLCDTSLPPLTPPPSYQLSSSTTNSMQKRTKSKSSHCMFPKIGSRKPSISPSYSSSSVSSSCSSSKSLPSTPLNTPFITCRKECLSRSRSAIYFDLDEEDNEQPAISTWCINARSGGSSRKTRAHYPGKNLRKAFLSIVGHWTA